MSSISAYYGLVRSFLLYYRNPFLLRRMARFYAGFIRPGDLCFDVGAHVGSRVAAWSRLGARVVAVEPLPSCVRVLHGLYGSDPNVEIVEAALGASRGRQEMLVSAREPTVSTLAHAWALRVPGMRRSFARTRWERSIFVSTTTLDELIARYGEPAFCKIDVEGYELEVLNGLSRPVPALSFECVPPAVDLAAACIERLCQLGRYEFNWSPGESMQLQLPRWVGRREIVGLLESLPAESVPGDVYARVVTPACSTDASAPTPEPGRGRRSSRRRRGWYPGAQPR